jgi:hypothetical protein
MESNARAPKSVVAAGVVAIIGSLLTGLQACFELVMLASLTKQPFPAVQRVSSRFEWVSVVLLAAAIYGVFVGFGLLRLKNWARISALIWAPVAIVGSAAFVIFGIVLFIPTFSPPLAGHFEANFRLATILVSAVPLGVGIWWLILFNRHEIVLRFLDVNPQALPPHSIS